MAFYCVTFADSDSGAKEKNKIGGGTPRKVLVASFLPLVKQSDKRGLSKETILKTTAVIFIWIDWGGKEQKKNKVCVLVI